MLSLLTLVMLNAPADLAQPLTTEQIAQAKAWVAMMVEDPRGPFAGVLWFCADGTQQEPKKYACAERGGGKQYGVPKLETKKLGELGLHLGTVLTALPPGSFLPDNYYRGRAFLLEAYLERALDGWVLKRAKTYRGFRQMEDEEAAARWLLIDLAMREDVLARHRNLLVRLMRALPYGKVESRADEVRTLAGLLGDADTKGFGDLRFKIHAMPEPADIDKVLAYAASTPKPELKTQAEQLAQKMREYYEPVHRIERLRQVRQWVHDPATKAEIDLFAAVDPTDALAVVQAGARLIQTAEKALRPGRTAVQGERNLLLLHVMAIVEELWLGVTADFVKRPLTRVQVLQLTEAILRSAKAIGWLSSREAEAAFAASTRMRGKPESTATPAADYAGGLKELVRVLEWARGRVLADLGLPLERYAAIEPRANAVVDDQMRSSMLLPLAALFDRLSDDVERLRGGGHQQLGLGEVGAGSLRGENAGLAVGPLRIVTDETELAGLGRHEIVLLHRLPPELPPVAGILTVGPAGSLSHVSLLARNLGLPHAAVGGEVAAAAARLTDQPVVLGVSAGGRVVFGAVSGLPAEVRDSLSQKKPDEAWLVIDAKALDLKTSRLHALAEISEEDSGVRVGPKAGELGRLFRLFPTRVADAAVIPFGAFVRHVDRPGPEGQPSPLAVLRQTYARVASLSAAQAEREALVALAGFRKKIKEQPFVEGFAAEVETALGRMGKPGTFGVFVRSDTNVEDLKEFTGAGLNLTVPNRVRVDEILASIREVWASPFTERSFRWRQRLLKNPEHVYPSVILHKTVPSEVSGVMVTVNLETGEPNALTISASEGVAGVVDGGAPETVVVHPDGRVQLLASARSATCKRIPPPPAGGIVRVQAEGREPLLGPAEIEALRVLASEVRALAVAKNGLPSDIEFGLLNGKALLMQLRPLRLSRAGASQPFLRSLDEKARLPQALVDLAERVP